MKSIRTGVEISMHGNFGQDRGSVKEHACGVFLTRLSAVSEQHPSHITRNGNNT
jgi:hypothetical protein